MATTFAPMPPPLRDETSRRAMERVRPSHAPLVVPVLECVKARYEQGVGGVLVRLLIEYAESLAG